MKKLILLILISAGCMDSESEIRQDLNPCVSEPTPPGVMPHVVPACQVYQTTVDYASSIADVFRYTGQIFVGCTHDGSTCETIFNTTETTWIRASCTGAVCSAWQCWITPEGSSDCNL